jgi:hypothetical protein
MSELDPEVASNDLRHGGGLIQDQADQYCLDGGRQGIDDRPFLEKVL